MPPMPEEAPSKVLVKQGGPRRSPGQEFGRSRSAALSEWFFSGSPHLNGFRVRKSVQYEHGLSLPSPGCCSPTLLLPQGREILCIVFPVFFVICVASVFRGQRLKLICELMRPPVNKAEAVGWGWRQYCPPWRRALWVCWR